MSTVAKADVTPADQYHRHCECTSTKDHPPDGKCGGVPNWMVELRHSRHGCHELVRLLVCDHCHTRLLAVAESCIGHSCDLCGFEPKKVSDLLAAIPAT